MDDIILLSAAFQRWAQYNTHALAARDVAAELALGASQALCVLSVYDYPPETSRSTYDDAVASQRAQLVVQTDDMVRSRMDSYIAPLIDSGIQVQPLLRVRNPREVIIEVAKELRATMLVIGTHSKRGLLDISLGGTAQWIARQAPCTVVMASPKS